MIKIKRDGNETDYTDTDAVPFEDFATINVLTSFRVVETDVIDYDVTYEIKYIEDDGYRTVRSITVSTEKAYTWKKTPQSRLITGTVAEFVEKEFSELKEEDRWILLKDITKDILDLCVKEKINFDPD